MPRFLRTPNMDFPSLDQNPFFSASLAFMLAGGVLVSLRRIPGLIFDFVERFFIIKMEIRDEDEAYQWMQVWLADRLRDTLAISVITKRSRIHDEDLEVDDGGRA